MLNATMPLVFFVSLIFSLVQAKRQIYAFQAENNNDECHWSSNQTYK